MSSTSSPRGDSEVGIREAPQEPSSVEALKAEIKRLRGTLVEAREEIIGMTRMRGFEGEGTDADYVSFIDAALLQGGGPNG